MSSIVAMIMSIKNNKRAHRVLLKNLIKMVAIQQKQNCFFTEMLLKNS